MKLATFKINGITKRLANLLEPVVLAQST